jgi:hypothetical protein
VQVDNSGLILRARTRCLGRISSQTAWAKSAQEKQQSDA